MAAGIRSKIHDAPLHVMPSSDGAVRVLMPDGHSLTLSVEAAERSALLLARAAERTRAEGKRPRRAAKPAAAEVIAVDFVHHSRLH